ncbi:hypothetical protein AMS62_26615 [Bacillus sp. FJAT-18019]|nr:hypothetical protein AMS62_26615 [Bacillus sp. FJAT-18019]
MDKRVTAYFSLNFFKSGLKIAEDGVSNLKAPSWNEINKMKERSFPKIAFKYNVSMTNSPIQLCISPDKNYYEESILCSNKNHKPIKQLDSCTPPRIALMVIDKPSHENKKLQQYVNNYVSKFRI